MSPHEKRLLSGVMLEVNSVVTLCALMEPHFYTDAAMPEEAADVLRIIKSISVSVSDAIDDLVTKNADPSEPISGTMAAGSATA